MMKLFCLEGVFHRCFGFGHGVAGSYLSTLLESQRLLLDLLSGVPTEMGDVLSPLIETASFELDVDEADVRNHLMLRRL